MTDIGEAIAVSIGSDPSESCFFCQQKPKAENLKNDEQADPDTPANETESSVPENDLHNDASKLGKNIGGQPEWTIKCPETDEPTKVMTAAHHCIPGNASFAKATNLHKFIRKDGPFKYTNDIGYSINHAGNGVWLPGNYYVRKGNAPHSKNWSLFNDTFKNEYAKRAVEASHLQFHDAHPEYSENVLSCLNKFTDRIGKPKEDCPFCGKKLEKNVPPYGLVGAIDTISNRHKGMLTQLDKKVSRKKKKIAAGYFTSSRMKTIY
jgi:A nuclease family of the HNH/ENDO VII superfamily with conserved AHH